jgi:hypothetical protein
MTKLGSEPMTVLNTVTLYMIKNVLIQNYVWVIKHTLETMVFVDETKYKISGTLQFTVYYVCPKTLL